MKYITILINILGKYLYKKTRMKIFNRFKIRILYMLDINGKSFVGKCV